ncbi:glycoside hydrolase family 19 protein [Variovorax atrisoli]|uniref:glycoside hydrolase family 19 protein n=1 Tax=Variovorax atrisoli TaxID=3394203 RepID=UPI00036311D7|nr:glycoside hydrolase family 19 protein [Variovorax paradoxus]
MKRFVFGLALLAFFSTQAQAGNLDRTRFYAECEGSKTLPKSLFKGDRRAGIDRILNYWEKTGYTDQRWLAYILGTAYRESVGTMAPVREGLCKTDSCSIEAVGKHFRGKHISSDYSKPDAQGRSYFGRGLVQITHKRKYESVGKTLGWGDALVEKPELALDPDKSVVILVEGMAQGLFTGRSLADSFKGEKADWVGARKIVNPGSRRAEITAGHGKDFYECLNSSSI